jgi:hypothetical protein
MKRAWHLTHRFFGAIRPGGPRAVDTEWVATVLTPEELALWTRMPGHDRRHSIGVARRVERTLGSTPYAEQPQWLAAALLHDVGKLDAELGPIRRVGATLAGAVAGRDLADAWSAKRGITRRVGLYLRHPEIGATRIRMIGGREEAAKWAAAHHETDPERDSGLPDAVANALREADDD